MKKRFCKKGQVWVETVIYILIALMMIGAVLAFAQPKIQEIQDKLLIDKTFESLQEFDKQIITVAQGGAGNKRVISIELRKGELEISPSEDFIMFTLEESRSTYSEPAEEDEFIKIGNIGVNTVKTGKINTVKLRLKYSEGTYEYDITNEEDQAIKLTRSSSPYKISITNEGISPSNEKINIKIEQIV